MIHGSARKKNGQNPEFPVQAGVRAKFEIRAGFRVQNLIFLRIESCRALVWPDVWIWPKSKIQSQFLTFLNVENDKKNFNP